MSRNRLSSIDLLPPEADAHIVWAVSEIEAGKRLLKDILSEFNSRLADHGIAPIASSSWSRYAVRKRSAFQKIKEETQIANAIASGVSAKDDDDMTIAVVQFAKAVAIRHFQRNQDPDSKSLMEIMKAVQAAETAKRTSAGVRKEVQKEEALKAATAIEKIAREAGLPKERIAQLRREFLGVKPKPPKVAQE